MPVCKAVFSERVVIEVDEYPFNRFMYQSEWTDEADFAVVFVPKNVETRDPEFLDKVAPDLETAVLGMENVISCTWEY